MRLTSSNSWLTSVLRSLIEAVDLRLQVGSNRKTRRIVGRAVNAQTGRQLGNDVLKLFLVVIQIELDTISQQIVGDAQT